MSSTTSKRERQKARRAEQRAATQAAAQRRRRTRHVRLGLVAALVAIAVVGIAALMVRGTDATLGVPAANASGEPLAPFPDDPAADEAAGMASPHVVGYDPDGRPVRLGDTGRPQAISFLAHWCPHCQEEVPEVVDWAEAGSVPEGVELVAVSTHHDPARPNWPPDAWLQSENWPGAVLLDHDLTATEAFGARGTPFWVFLDADGTVVARHPGRVTLDQLRGYLDAIAEG